MSVALVNPPDPFASYRYPTNRPPYDILYIESFLSSCGEQTHYLDMENTSVSFENCLRELDDLRADYYIINTTGKAYHFRARFWDYNKTDECVGKVAKRIRDRNENAIIILVGETIKYYPGKYAKIDFDFFIFDEPEYTIKEIVCSKEKKGREIKGVAYFHEEKVHFAPARNQMKTLDELPAPRWELLGGHYWDSTFREEAAFIDIPGMRGCPHSCTFCKSRKSQNVLYHSPDYLAAQIKILHEKYGYTDFFIRDSGYCDRDEYAYQLSSLLEKIPDIRWKCNARIDSMHSDKLKAMRRSGCSLVSYGIESSNQKTLARILKGINSQDILRLVRLTQACDIRVATYFLLGLPGESWYVQLQSLLYARFLKPDVLFVSPYYEVKKGTANIVERFWKIYKFLWDVIILSILFFWEKTYVVYYCKIPISRKAVRLFMNAKKAHS